MLFNKKISYEVLVGQDNRSVLELFHIYGHIRQLVRKDTLPDLAASMAS